MHARTHASKQAIEQANERDGDDDDEKRTNGSAATSRCVSQAGLAPVRNQNGGGILETRSDEGSAGARSGRSERDRGSCEGPAGWPAGCLSVVVKNNSNMGSWPTEEQEKTASEDSRAERDSIAWSEKDRLWGWVRRRCVAEDGRLGLGRGGGDEGESLECCEKRVRESKARCDHARKGTTALRLRQGRAVQMKMRSG